MCNASSARFATFQSGFKTEFREPPYMTTGLVIKVHERHDLKFHRTFSGLLLDSSVFAQCTDLDCSS